MKRKIFILFLILGFYNSLYHRYFDKMFAPSTSDENIFYNVIFYVLLLNSFMFIFVLYHRYWEERLPKTHERSFNVLGLLYPLSYDKILDIDKVTFSNEEESLAYIIYQFDYEDKNEYYRLINQTKRFDFYTKEINSIRNHNYINLVFFEMMKNFEGKECFFSNSNDNSSFLIKKKFFFKTKDSYDYDITCMTTFSVENIFRDITLSYLFFKQTDSFLKVNYFSDESFFNLHRGYYVYHAQEYAYFHFNLYEQYNEIIYFHFLGIFNSYKKTQTYLPIFHFINYDYDFENENNKNGINKKCFFYEKFSKDFLLNKSNYHFNIDIMMGNYYELNCRIRKLNKDEITKTYLFYNYKKEKIKIYKIFIKYYKFKNIK